jgi:hypothetical protein
MNKSLLSRVEDLEKEKGEYLERMATIIDKNEDLESEMNIITRALELKDL